MSSCEVEDGNKLKWAGWKDGSVQGRRNANRNTTERGFWVEIEQDSEEF
jgi:hypothetical protein